MVSPVNNQQSLLNIMAQMQQVAAGERVMPADNQIGLAADFKQVVRAVNTEQNIAADLMAAVDAGRSDDVVGAMVASQKADLSFSMLMQIRNKILSGIDDVMRMSL
ncbi:flagellar hook-basal body complex protein FliE [Alishewanella sp. BS5-314]|uniref:flagellar hook-basal body complex protein FliE n=1 Tax=Alishewanella sp. BS5-314 TaxID=2755587 RepID=UPI0021BB9AFE|nr:flagellar hook-basal body complex protein FliE [Alishewanella sp. BS5-314]MCT8124999.1 flagellar hook-basal body complex protein FliE [Alishewanella sp. BS5-314]